MDNRPGKGTARVTRRYVEYLLEHQEEFDFTLIHECPTPDPLYKKTLELILPNIPFPFARKFFNETIFWIRLRLSGKRFDIVHYLNPRVWPSYLLAPSKKIMVNAYEAGVMLNYHRTDLGTRIFQFTNRYLHHRMDAIIALSEYGKKEIVEYFHISPKKVHVIYCGVDNNFVRFSNSHAHKQELLSQFGLPEQYLLSVGRLDPHKNIVRLIKAYALARIEGLHLPLVLVGGKHLREYSQEVEKTIIESGVEGHVVYAPYIPDEDLPAVYSCATALIFPSLHEGFGLPLVEAMACGVPIATSNTTSLPEVAGDAALLFDPLDVEDMARTIVAVTRHNDIRDMLIARGRTRIQLFTWEKAIEQVRALYHKLINE
jgi:glycosyltransferase involved in cell wall biosynthesis